MTSEPKSGRDAPRYLQLADDLRGAIHSGRLAEGALLPTESALCAQYGVSRFTVREALRRLQSEGLIRRRRGSGTIVAPPRQLLRQTLSDVSELLQYASGSEFSFTNLGLVTLSSARMDDLGLHEGDRWVHLLGIRRKPGGSSEPIAVTDVYIHPALAAHVPALRPGTEAIFTQLARAAGFRVVEVVQTLQAQAAGSHEAAALGIARRAPVLRIVRIYRDETGRTVEVSVSAHPGDRFSYAMRMDH
jgi:DNA-binding GntR family transcriptional regulator